MALYNPYVRAVTANDITGTDGMPVWNDYQYQMQRALQNMYLDLGVMGTNPALARLHEDGEPRICTKPEKSEILVK